MTFLFLQTDSGTVPKRQDRFFSRNFQLIIILTFSTVGDRSVKQLAEHSIAYAKFYAFNSSEIDFYLNVWYF